MLITFSSLDISKETNILKKITITTFSGDYFSTFYIVSLLLQDDKNYILI